LSADHGSPDRPEHDVDVESALRVVAHPPARPEFRDQLRNRFLETPEGRASASGRSGSRMGWLLAAAVVLAAGYFLLRPRAPEWRVLEVAPGTVVKVGDAPLPLEDRAALARALRDAPAIVVESGDLLLQAGDLALFDLGAGTRVELAGFHPDEGPGPLAIRASSGRMRARTGPGFAGRQMEVRAGTMELVVAGTAFAVDYEEVGTCVCCLHGKVEMVSKATGAAPRAIEPGKMCLVFKEERPPLWGDSPEAHAQPLERLEARALEIWR